MSSPTSSTERSWLTLADSSSDRRAQEDNQERHEIQRDHAGREVARYWVTFETFCEGEDMERDVIIPSAVWGDERGTLVFFVGARNTTERQELLTPVVEAALTTLGPDA